MTMQLIVLYTHPEDVEAFESHYRDVHAPLVDAVPGLDHWQSGRIVAAPDGGEQQYYRIAQLSFADQETLQAALGSPEGHATAADFQSIAPAGSRMYVVAKD